VDSSNGRQTDITLSAPELRSVSLRNYRTNLNVWQSLTHLSLRTVYPHGTQFFRLLGRCPDLEQLKLHDVYFIMPDPEVQAVELRRLSILELRYLEPTLATYLFRHISIPSSAPLVAFSPVHPVSFSFHFQDGHIMICRYPKDIVLHIIEPSDMDFMISVLIASVDIFPIRELVVDYDSHYPGRLSLDRWKTIFEAVPSLTVIMLRLMPRCMKTALRALYPDEQSGLVVCPALEELDLRVDRDRGSSASTVADLDLNEMVVGCIKARSRSDITRLVKLKMNFGEDSAIAELCSLVENVFSEETTDE